MFVLWVAGTGLLPIWHFQPDENYEKEQGKDKDSKTTDIIESQNQNQN